MNVTHETTCRVRWMIRRDMPEVMLIEQTARRREILDENGMLDLLRRPLAIGYVVIDGQEVIQGFSVVMLRKSEIEIERFRVRLSAPAERFAGVMMDRIKSRVSATRRNVLFGMVPEDDLDGLNRLKAWGFTATAVERGYFGQRDGIRMEWRQPTEGVRDGEQTT